MQRTRVARPRLRSLLQPQLARIISAWLPFLAALALEAAPVQAWLVVYPSTLRDSGSAAAAPFWLVAGIMALFAYTRWKASGLGAVALVGAWLLAAGIAFLALARFSPLLFGLSPEPLYSLDWLIAWWNGEVNSTAFAPLIALMLYLGWRGSVLGGSAPAFSQVSRRFGIGMGALTLAIFGSLATEPALRGAVAATLLALLALEGFAGLAALAMARTHAAAAERIGSRMPGAAYSTRWQLSALSIAFGIMVVVTLVGSLFNLAAGRALLAWLGPAGEAINQVTYWLTQGLAYLLYLISVAWLSLFVPTNLPNQKPHLPKPPPGGTHPNPTHLVPSQFGAAASIILIAAAVAVAIVLVFIMARIVVRSLSKPVEDEVVEEEREDLDAAALLQRQARDWLDGLRSHRAAPEQDELRKGGVRWLYRQVMRAGARLGYERRASETADEYAARLSSTLVEREKAAPERIAAQLAGVTGAYDEARYGAVEDDPSATGEVADQARSLREYLEALERASARPR